MGSNPDISKKNKRTPVPAFSGKVYLVTKEKLKKNIIPCSRVFVDMTLVVGTHGELGPALVAYVGLQPLMGLHVLL